MTLSSFKPRLVSDSERSPHHQSGSILIVDDDAVSRTFIKMVLKRHGYPVIEADDGIQGMSLYRQFSPILVMLDAKMPGLNGFDCCRKIRALPDGQHIPILMVTGADDETSVHEAFAAGATDFVTKPVKMPVLIGRVQYLIQAALAERSLRQSEAKYRSLVTSLKEVIFQLDAAGRLAFVNPIWSEVMGHRLEASLGQPFAHFLHPAERKRHQAQVEEAWRHPGQELRYRSRGVSQDGQVRWVEIQLCAHTDPTGTAAHIAGRLNDISDRTTREQYRRLEIIITRILAKETDGARAIQRVMQALCGNLGFQVGEFWQLERSRQHLTCQAQWHLNRGAIAQFTHLSQSITFQPGEGIPGAAWHAEDPCWLPDFSPICSVTRRSVAQQAGLRSAIGFSVNQGPERLGVIVLFGPTMSPPDSDLLRVLTILGRQVGQYLKRHQAEQQIQAQNCRLQSELQRAAEYVESLLPKDAEQCLSSLTTPSCLSLSTLFQPSSTLGGDVFDYARLDPDHLMFYLLDVAGHGVKSALLSVSILNILRRKALKAADFYRPQTVLAALNDMFQVNDNGEDYFTLWYGVYHLPSRQLTFATAGHPPGLLITPQGSKTTTELLDSDGIAIGLFPDFPFAEKAIAVPPNSHLYIFSDGVFEVPTHQDHQIWGFDAWRSLVEAHVRSPTTSLNSLLEAVRNVNGHPVLDDDFSVLEVTFS